MVRIPKADGTFEAGERRINETEAQIVRRIFEAYANGMAPRKIAFMLNEEAVPGPRRKGWGASTVHGNSARGVGILNNQLYVGRLVWNKLKYVKDTTTGKRRSRNNDAAEIVEKDVPHLRIISDELWWRVKARQKRVSFTVTGAAKEPWDRRRPRYLLSGLTKCSCCGGGYVMISKTHLGCATARNKGLCSNRLATSRAKLEELVLTGLKHRLMAPDLFKEFCKAFFAEVNRARLEAGVQRTSIEAELAKMRRRIRQIVDAIGDGHSPRSLKDELLALETREDILLSQLEVAPQPKVLLNPKMAEVYRSKVADLQVALENPESGPEAAEAIRSLIEKIVVVPVDRQGYCRSLWRDRQHFTIGCW